MEAAPGFEPGVGVLQTPALPLGYAAVLSTLRNKGRCQLGWTSTGDLEMNKRTD